MDAPGAVCEPEDRIPELWDAGVDYCVSSRSLRLGFSKMVADAEQLDQRCRQRYSEVGSTIKRQPNSRLIEEQKAHAQFSSLIESGGPGIALLLCLHDSFGCVDMDNLVEVLQQLRADIQTVHLLSKAGLITLDGDLLALSDDGTQIATRIEQLVNE